jgi:hypothetical protein
LGSAYDRDQIGSVFVQQVSRFVQQHGKKIQGLGALGPNTVYAPNPGACWEGNIMSSPNVIRRGTDLSGHRLGAALAASLLVLLSGIATSLLSAFHALS